MGKIIRVVVLVHLVLLLLGCANKLPNDGWDQQGAVIREINLEGIHKKNLSILEKYKNHPYMIASVEVEPSGKIAFSNALESAIQLRSLESAKYILSLGAVRTVAMSWSDPLTGKWMRTYGRPVTELTCVKGYEQLHNYLRMQYPDERPNYTNCLHYFISNKVELLERSPDPEHRIKKYIEWMIVAGGADPNQLPEYGSSLYFYYSDIGLDTLIQETLLNNGLNPNTQFECLLGQCSLLADKHFVTSTPDLIKHLDLLLAHGFDINKTFQRKIPVAVLSDGSLKYEMRQIGFLHLAAYYDSPDAYALLLSHGANEQITDNLGNTAFKYSGLSAVFVNAAKVQRSKYLAANKRKKDDSNDLFAKTLAIGLGAVAIGSMDIPSDLAGEAIGALATDIITDNGGRNVGGMYQQASEGLFLQRQQDFQHAVNKVTAVNPVVNNSAINNKDKSRSAHSKNVDCGHEYYKAEMSLRNSGHLNFGSCDPQDIDSCSRARDNAKLGAINNELVSRGYSQCQQSSKQQPSRQETPSSDGGDYET